MITLYADAMAVHKRMRMVLEEVGKACGGVLSGVRLKEPAQPLKKMSRVVQKSAFDPDNANGATDMVLDVVRDMIEVTSLSAAATVVEQLLKTAEIKVVRMKDRFSYATPDGWRDVLVNFQLVDDENCHVMEVQIVHKAMQTARSQLPGHFVYSRVRSATELLTKIGIRDKWDRPTRAKSLAEARDWTFSQLLSIGVCSFADLLVCGYDKQTLLKEGWQIQQLGPSHLPHVRPPPAPHPPPAAPSLIPRRVPASCARLQSTTRSSRAPT